MSIRTRQLYWCVSLSVLASTAFTAEPPPFPPSPPGAPPSLHVAPAPLASQPAPAVPAPPPVAPLTFGVPTPLPSPTAALPAPLLASTNLAGPRLQFDAIVHDFGKAMSGDLVKHIYYFTNIGSEDLVLSNVASQCGCSAAGDWTRVVKPGASGLVPVQFNTLNYNQPVVKLFTVTSNDKSQPYLSLQLKGTVWKPIDVQPSIAALNLKPDVLFAAASIHITNGLEQPMLLSPPESSNTAFGAQLITNSPGKDYTLIISNTAALPPGSVQGTISLRTSLTNLPVISIVTWANSQPAINIVPMRIDLRQAPLVTNQLAYVTVINNCTNPLSLSEPAVNAQDIGIKITESQPGRYFTAVLTFPTGFELPAGQPGLFTVKTSHPQFPLVKVPIYQAPRAKPAQVILQRPAAPASPAPLRSLPLPPSPSAAAAAPVGPLTFGVPTPVPGPAGADPVAGSTSPSLPPHFPPRRLEAPPGANPVPLVASTNLAGPKLQFDAIVHDFGKAMSGELVKHIYYFTNTGAEDLIVSNVASQCGCSSAGQWTRVVKPGASGLLPVQFDTRNYNQPVVKLFTVTSNDKTQPYLALQLKGTVWKPVDVQPSIAVLNLKPDVLFAAASIHITNSLEQPMLLSPPESTNSAFGALLRTNYPGKDYTVIISNTAALPPGSAQGAITLQTSLTNLPVISILTWANVQQTINILPLRIDLRPAPLPTNQLAYVRIINNSTNALSLSEPAVNTPDVGIEITETQPGHYFTAVLKFPTGFELPAGQPGLFTVNTSNPQFPLVKVPIYQTPRAKPPAVVLQRPPALASPGPLSSLPQPPRPPIH